MTYTPRWTLKLDWTKDQEMFFGEQVCTSRNGSSNRYFPFVMSMNHNSTTHILNTSISEPLGKRGQTEICEYQWIKVISR